METTPYDWGDAPGFTPRDDRLAGVALDRFLERVPAAFLVTRGPDHVLVSANAMGRRLLAAHGSPTPGRPLREAIPDGTALVTLLDQAFRTGIVLRDRDVAPAGGGPVAWRCSVWPDAAEGDAPVHLVTELRVTPEPEPVFALQRRVTERLLLGALREHDRASAAEASRARAAFLAAESERLGGSLDRAATERAVAQATLPYPGSWCIVDLIHDGGGMQRLGIVHADPLKQELARELDGRWMPRDGDAFGAPAMRRAAEPLVVDGDDASPPPDAEHGGDPVTRRVLAELGAGSMLTVPLHIHGRLAGALTFVTAERDRRYTPEEVALAQALAARSATALDNARQHADAIATRQHAELQSRAKSAFIGHMSHELRTPLNAISGYVDLIDMGLRGPVTELQRADLARIRLSQQHLVALLTNVLNFVREEEGLTQYHLVRVDAGAAFAVVVDMLEPLVQLKSLTIEVVPCDARTAAYADPEKLTQVLVNLVANAVKFTPRGGRLTLSAEATRNAVWFRVADTGIGIAPESCAVIFEPFVQVPGASGALEGGIGLGLAISRALARGMGGDLTVESTPGRGSTFTLSLPRVA